MVPVEQSFTGFLWNSPVEQSFLWNSRSRGCPERRAEESCLQEEVGGGWGLRGLQFSKRPCMVGHSHHSTHLLSCPLPSHSQL